MSSTGWDEAKDDGWNLREPATPTPTKKAKKPRNKRRGLWWKIPLILLALLLLLVMLLPTLLGTSPVRRLVLRQTEGLINGKLDIDDWSFGWFTGIKLSGVRVLDARMRSVVSVGRIRVPLPLWKAAMMDFRFGEVAIENVKVHVEVDEAGNTNLQTLARSSTPPADAPPPPSAVAPGPLPLLVGRLSVTGLEVEVQRLRTNPGGELESVGPAMGLMSSSNIAIDIDTERGRIAQKIRLALGVDDVSMGDITLDGESQLLTERKLDLDHLQTQQSLAIHEMDLSRLRPVLASLGIKLDISGIVSGEVTVHAESGGAMAGAQGEIRLDRAAVAGELVGEPLTLPPLALPLDLSVDDGGGRLKVKQTGLRIGANNTLLITADLPLELLEDLKAQRKPRSSGKVGLRVEIPELGSLLASLPGRLSANAPAKVTKGGLAARFDLAMEPSDFTLTGEVASKNLEAAVRGKDPIALPLEASVRASLHPAEPPLQAIHDVAVVATTPGFSLRAEASTISQVKVTANADVAQLREALGAITAFGPLHGAKVSLVATSEGNVTVPGSPLQTSADLEVTGMDVRLREGRAAELPQRLAMHMGASLTRRPDGGASGVNDGVLSLMAGEEKQPLLAARVEFTAQLPGDGATATPQRLVGALESAQVSVKQFDIDLAQAWAAASEVAAMPIGRTLTRGMLSVTANCGLSGTGAEAAVHVASNDVRVKQAGQSTDMPSLSFDMHGQASRNAKGLSVIVKELAVTVGKALVLKAKQDLLAELPKDGPPAASGALRLDIHLGEVDRLKREFTGEGLIPASAKGFDFREGTVVVNAALGTAVSGDLAARIGVIIDAAVAAPGGLLKEQVTTDLTVNAASGLSDANVELRIHNRLFDLGVEKVRLSLRPAAGATVLDLLPRAEVRLRLPDLTAVQRTLAMLSPAPVAAPSSQQSAQLASGTLELSADLVRSGAESKLTVDSRLENLVLASGVHSYRFIKPQTVHLATQLVTLPQSDATDVLSQLASVSLSELRAELDVGTLSLAKPVALERPARLLASSKSGMTLPTVTVVFAGNLDSVAAIGEGLSGKAKGTLLPVSAGFTITQGVSLDAGRISVAGDVKLSDFVFRQGNTEVRESGVTLANKFSFDPADGKLTLHGVSVNLESGAMRIALTGTVAGVTTPRPQLERVELRLTPNWEKLWAMAKPLLSADQQKQMADLVIQGTQESIVRADGAIATSQATPALMLADLKLDADLAVEYLKWPSQGITLEAFSLPVDMVGGVVYTQHKSQPGAAAYTPATLNKGQLDVSELTLEVFAPHPRLTSPANKTVLKGIALNEVLAKALSNVSSIFLNPSKASGRVDLVLVDCKRFPLDDLMNSMRDENDGRLELLLSIAELQLASDGLSTLTKLGSFNSPDKEGGDSQLRGDIKDGRVTLEKGWLTHDLDIQLSQHHVICKGEMELGRKYYKEMTVNLPGSLMAGGTGSSGASDRVTLRFHGPANALTLDKSALAKDLAKRAAGDALDSAVKSAIPSQP